MSSTSFSSGTTIPSVWLNDVNNLVWGVFNGATTAALARTALNVSATGTDPNYMRSSNNLSDVANAGTSRTNLGLGTAAVANTGTSSGNVPALDSIGTVPTSEIKPLTSSRNSNTILGTADNFTFIYATGTFTQTLTAAATLGNRWWVKYRNNGTGIITIDPNGAETIDGQTTINLYTGESCTIYCDGSAFYTEGRSIGLVEIQSQTASSSATLDFTLGFSGDFSEMEFHLVGLLPATNDIQLYVRISEDGGSTYKAGGTDYAYQNNSLQAGVNNPSVTTAAQYNTQFNISNTTSDGGANGILRLSNFASTTQTKWFYHTIVGQRSATGPLMLTGNGRYITDNGAINGVRFLMASGNLASGTIIQYGVRK